MSQLSAVITAHNEAAQLADCLTNLGFADEIIVVLDRCSDNSASIVAESGARAVEGAWPIEGPRRHAGIDAATGPWILEVDADERVSPALAEEIRSTIEQAAPGYFLVPFDNYVGRRLVRYGWGASWGVNAAPRLFTKGAKVWGDQRIHPAVTLQGEKRRLNAAMIHYVDRDISDMLQRLDRYTKAKAQDLKASGEIGRFSTNVRRIFTRFFKCYVQRKGYREGAMGFMIALMAALYPILSYLRAQLDDT